MSYIETWKVRNQKEKEESNREWREKEKIEEIKAKEILSVLSAEYSITKVNTNNYWFSFNYNRLLIHFVNQTDRLCGEMYNPPLNKDEEECLRDGHRIMSDNKYKDGRGQFQREFNYRSFIFCGDMYKTVKNVVKLAQLPIEKVIELQDSHGDIHLERNESLEHKLEAIERSTKKEITGSTKETKLLSKIKNFFK